jgi:hypothetical protein
MGVTGQAGANAADSTTEYQLVDSFRELHCLTLHFAAGANGRWLNYKSMATATITSSPPPAPAISLRPQACSLLLPWWA